MHRMAIKLIPTRRPISPTSDNLGHGAEIAGVVLVFFLIGLGLDAWLNTTPLFMVILSIVAVVEQFAKMYFVYTHQMRELEKDRADVARGGQGHV